MLKILTILPGNPRAKTTNDSKTSFFCFKTLLEGECWFYEKDLINNHQTIKSIENMGNEVSVYVNSSRKGLVAILKSAIRLRRITREHRPDVVHIYWGGFSGLILLLLCPGNRVVSLLGSDLYGSKYNNWKSLVGFSSVQSISSKICALLAEGTIVMSKNMSDKLWNGRSRRILIKPEGVVLNKFFPKDMALARSLLGWSEDSFIFIFFDDGEYVKNKKLALETFEHFKKNHPKCEMKLINGFRHEELINVYNAANVLLLTSYHEGSNNSVKEALACNLPIVSVNCGDAEERLKNVTNSFICPYDYKELSLAVEAIYESGERSNGKDYLDEFLVENVAESISKFYSQILK